ncbi:3'(2'),5'-bisphosphate nucleotidase CysQ [Saccharomonospora glauca]|jgi:3'(2'), 5'-bisphosphate nucleotidase|uniref:3'-phosphoadenosine 5'-phosphosulfate (PAPS) 3'-phosphatase n=1 Tax=Saccharomonospora glauca K62 TaxID=928724 RepID=I1D6H6_9PSEU|nr:3'(2'),5'-bisphosphate nucleotidase CysQ [Saccharomonospora glauca]EIF00551.1 3'-phosphoadenosine 5'-phosphosulfate (PAPS) 3'-phosphatase [Saccharomonospora glauca K62]
MTDARLAARLAAEAGELLLRIRDETSREPVRDPRALGRRGDAESNALIVRTLAEHRPGDAVLSEESADDPKRLRASRVWIVDPLDGTREYGLGRPDWTVHVALWQAGIGITAAAVAQPDSGLVMSTDEPRKSSSQLPGKKKRILVSNTRPPEFAKKVAEEVDAELVPMGSAGAKALAVARGEADAYVHAGGQYEWDSAAPVGVARSVGLHASRVDGSELSYNGVSPYLPDLLICRPELAEPLLRAIARWRD